MSLIAATLSIAVLATATAMAAPAGFVALDLVVPPGQTPSATALDHLATRVTELGAPAAALRVDGVTRLRRSGQVVRLGQRHGGLRVLDAGVAVLELGGRLVAASGRLARIDEVVPGRLVGQLAARAAVRSWQGSAIVRRANLALAPASSGLARRVWVLDVDAHDESGFMRYQVRVDAVSGRLLWARPALRPALGKAYPTNPTLSQLQQVELLGLTDPTALIGEHADVATCSMAYGAGLTCTRHAAPDADGNYLYEPEEPSFEDGFAEVNAYYHVDRIHRWFAERFGFARPGESQQIKVVVNTTFETHDGDTRGMYNAFYGDFDGDGVADLVFGQGQRDFAYDADVIYHEFTHSVVADTCDLQPNVDGLGLNIVPAAINEGFADLFSSMLAGDPVVGDYCVQGGIRNLLGAARCPESLIGESHTDGEVWGQALWAIRGAIAAADRPLFEEVVYQAMVALDQYPTFASAAALLLEVAQTAAPGLEPAIQTELQARGLLDCERVLPLKHQQKYLAYLMGTRSWGAGMVPASYQYRIEVPDNAEAIRLDVAFPHSEWAAATSGIGLFIRKGAPVEFQLTKAVHDFVMVNDSTSITLAAGDPALPLAPGASYYVLPVNVDRRGAEIELTLTVTATEPPAPDAGLPEAPPDAGAADASVADAPPDAGAGATLDVERAGGCDCATGAGPAPTGGLLLSLLLLATRLRSRPRRS